MEYAVRRNLPAVERRREMLEAALDIFALKGQGITVQELADKVGVTQPLVHRYFPVKSDLITAIKDALKDAHWNSRWEELLENEKLSLKDRLGSFYANYLPEIYKDRWFRGFTFAALDEPAFAREYMELFQGRLFMAIAKAARKMHGFPTVQALPVSGREMELVWSMHSTMAMMGVRKHIYKMEPGDDMLTVMNDQIEAYLLVVPQVLAKLMPKSAH